MKKVGIITFHNADNFGAVLQCYATQRYFSDLNINAIVVDTQDNAISDFYKLFRNKRSIKSLLLSFLQLKSNVKRKNKFKKFRDEYLNISKNYSNCDMFVCGSDQIWNFDITHGYNPVYFASFQNNTNAVKISYAASIGVEAAVDENKSTILKNELSKFDMISVREENARNTVSSIIDKDVSVVPDPTLLLSSEIWNSFVNNEFSSQKYILIYNLRKNALLYEIAQKLSNSLNIPIIEIRARSKNIKEKHSHKIIDDIGPVDFLNSIKNAEYVITDSYHGTVFSVIFQKNFYCISPSEKDDRMKTLLSNLGLEKRVVNSIEQVCFENNILYENVKPKLEEYAAVGKSYIAQANERMNYVF